MRLLNSLRWSISLLVVIGTVALGAVFSQGYWMQGEIEQQAQKGSVLKDALADILPPPMYLLEMRLRLSEAIEGTLDVATAKREVDRLSDEYQARIDHWKKTSSDGLDKELVGKNHELSLAFIAAAKNQVMVKLQSGDAEAAKQALVETHKLFMAHRESMNPIVTRVGGLVTAAEKSLLATQEQANMLALVVSGSALAALLVLSRLVMRSIEEPVVRCTELARKIATGDLTRDERSLT